jgi:hypothetical protein
MAHRQSASVVSETSLQQLVARIRKMLVWFDEQEEQRIEMCCKEQVRNLDG